MSKKHVLHCEVIISTFLSFMCNKENMQLCCFSLSVLMILLVTGITAVIMFISHTNNWLQQSSMFCHSSKKSLLNLLSGHYDIPQNTKVIWDWDEPQTVGKTMSFRVKVSMIILITFLAHLSRRLMMSL